MLTAYFDLVLANSIERHVLSNPLIRLFKIQTVLSRSLSSDDCCSMIVVLNQNTDRFSSVRGGSITSAVDRAASYADHPFQRIDELLDVRVYRQATRFRRIDPNYTLWLGMQHVKVTR